MKYSQDYWDWYNSLGPMDQYFADLRRDGDWFMKWLINPACWLFGLFVVLIIVASLFGSSGPFAHQSCQTLPTTDGNTGVTSTYTSCESVGPFWW
jgi:hypothetical protein